jgi:sialic acid synthase SpsE/quercetin dioxygenase-like cupin family protein
VQNLFILEIANNHNGDFEHAVSIIESHNEILKKYPQFNFAFKFQYRHIPTFIHPDFHSRTDLKYVKRFQDNQLEYFLYDQLVDIIHKMGHKAIVTCFDEMSAVKAQLQKFDYFKIASCSVPDWPLLETIVELNKPFIVSTAGVDLYDLDQVVVFFQNRQKDFSLMHCVGEYPTQMENLQLNQISFLHDRYKLPVGFSTHENPDNTVAIQMAIAQGATIFERHIDAVSKKYEINSYSSRPYQIHGWLESAKIAFEACGVKGERYHSSDKEINDLRTFKRGMFALRDINPSEIISNKDIFFAFPCQLDQYVANDFSKYSEFKVTFPIKKNEACTKINCKVFNKRQHVIDILNKLRKILNESHVALPERFDIEISHHYGIEKFFDIGAVIINIINREYAKKLLVLLPNQYHPCHSHNIKEETFQVLFGDMSVDLDGEMRRLKKGDLLTVLRGIPHSFSSNNGCIFEEVSTTSIMGDSFYDDDFIMKNTKNRKTNLTIMKDWLLQC